MGVGLSPGCDLGPDFCWRRAGPTDTQPADAYRTRFSRSEGGRPSQLATGGQEPPIQGRRFRLSHGPERRPFLFVFAPGAGRRERQGLEALLFMATFLSGGKYTPFRDMIKHFVAHMKAEPVDETGFIAYLYVRKEILHV